MNMLAPTQPIPTAAAPEANATPVKSVIIRYIDFAKRRRWLILSVIVASLILAVLATMLMTPKYRADATVEIRRESFRITSVQGVEPDAQPVDLEFYQTQYGLLQSSALAERVATDLKLVDDPAFFEMFGGKKTAAILREGGAASRTPAAHATRTRQAGVILLGHLAITPTRSSRLVTIGFTSPNAEFSARVTNAWTRLFIETSLERKYEATAYARKFLETRLDQLRRRLEESERLLVSYAAREGIVNLPSAIGADGRTVEQPLAAENLSTLNRDLNEAIAARVQAQSRLGSGGGTTTEALSNQAISSLRSKRAELAAEYARLLTQFEPLYPPAVALQRQIQQIDSSISREEGRVSGTLRATYEAASSREAELRKQVESLKGDLVDLRGRSIQYNIYQREVDTNRQLYDGLLQRYKEIGVAGGVGVNNISIVDAARPPLVPSSPNLILNLALALVVGFAAAIGLALIFDQADESISEPSEVLNRLGVPLIGAAPRVDGDPRAALSDLKSELVEAYLSAQTSLGFTTDHGLPRSMAVTSARPGEGKSTTAYALSRSMVRTGRRTVLIDADMRSPSVHNMFDVPNGAGTSNFLAGEDALDSLIHADETTGIYYITAGPTPPNAAELLSADRITTLIDRLLTKFDNVVIDMPPVMGLADAPIIASHVEGVAFVVQSHATGTSVVRLALGRLAAARARVLGVVLTKFESRKAHYGYGHAYGYGYGDKDS